MARIGSLAVVTVLSCVFAAGAAARDYHGKAQALMPTPKEIGFSQVLQFKPAKKPTSNLKSGWQAGVAAIYAKGKAKSPVEAVATVYVYSGAPAAKTALQHACPNCPHVN